jgi:dipeptidyl aminopeptidase/acylaminoacyl peptidase
LYGKNPSAEFLKAASPVYQVTPSYPPTMLVHGTADTQVDYSNSMRFFKALEEAGVPVDMHLYAGQDHIFDREPMFADAVCDAMELFIERYVPVPATS